jgi:hypothetical protein
MKNLFLFLILISVKSSFAQGNGTNADTIKRIIRQSFDYMPLVNADSVVNFEKAISFHRNGEFVKAGRLFQRLYWLDSSSRIGTESKLKLSEIENSLRISLKREMLGSWKQDFTTVQGLDSLSKKIAPNEVTSIKILPSKIILTNAAGLSIEKPFEIDILFDWFYGVNGISLKHSEVDTTYLNLLTLLDSNSYLGSVVYRTSEMAYGVEKCFRKNSK